MAMLDLLLGLYEGGVAMETDGVLGCVVWVCQEVMSTCQGWRHTSKGTREELGESSYCVLATTYIQPTSF